MYVETPQQWDAIQWTGTNLTEVYGFLSRNGLQHGIFTDTNNTMLLVKDLPSMTGIDLLTPSGWLLARGYDPDRGLYRPELQFARDDNGKPFGFAEVSPAE